MIKRDRSHPIGSGHIHTMNKKRVPKRHIFQNEEVIMILKSFAFRKF